MRATVANGKLQSKTNTGQWLTASFALADAAFANRLPGGSGHPGSDLRIDSRGDGDETVHLVLVQGDERPAPPSPVLGPGEPVTPTVTPTATPTRADPQARRD